MNYVNEQNMQEILDGISRKIGQGGSKVIYTGSSFIATDTDIVTEESISDFSHIVIKSSYTDGTDTVKVSTVYYPEIGDISPLSYTRNSSNYCVLEISVNSDTTLHIDLLELTGFTGYKIDKIIGVTGTISE